MILFEMSGVIALGVLVLILNIPVTIFAGPPYITDDPEPVEYRHWEVYLASIFTKQPEAWTATAPHLEVNYGALPNLQLHTILPMTLYAPAQGASSYGYSDTELGAKYRFVQERKWLPQIGTFPLLEVPTGSHARNLVADICRHSCPFGCKRVSGRGPRMVVVATGSIPLHTTRTGGLADWLFNARLSAVSPQESSSSTEPLR
jgi:hypothetical protein